MKRFISKRNIIVTVLLILTSASFFYMDSWSNIRQGMLIWEALFSGRFFQYYSVCSEAHSAGLMAHDANYGIVQSVFMGLWQLPLYLLEKLVGGDILRFFAARVYGKMYTIFIAGIAFRN